METNQKVKKIVFFNSIIEVDSYLNNNLRGRRFETSDTLFIAMNPIVKAYLIQRGVRAQNTLSYFGNDSRLKAMKKSQILVEWIEEKVRFCNLEIGIQNAYKNWFIFLLRFAVNYALFTIDIILNAVDMYQPEVVSASCSGKRPVTSVYIEPEEKYLGYLVSTIAGLKKIKFEDIATKWDDKQNFSFAHWFNFIKPMVRYLLTYGKFKLWEKLLLCKKIFGKKRKIILFTSRLYQMDSFAQRFQGQVSRASLFFLDGPVISSVNIPDFLINLFWREYSKIITNQRQIFVEFINTVKKEKTFFSYRDISFAEVIAQKTQSNIAPYIIGQFLWSFHLNHCVDSLRPSAVVSCGNRPDDVILAELCQQKNIPNIFISHGSYVSPKNEHERFEWGEHGRVFLRAPFLFHALQSPLAEGYLDTFTSSSKIIKTGPLIWGTPVDLNRSKFLFRKMFGDKYDFENVKVVLHAGTPKSSNILRFHVYEVPEEYIQALCELAEAIEGISGAILVIKFRPQSEISVDDLKSLVPFSDKVVLSVDEPFKDVLGMASLLISFSSTTIEEALQNRIPVLLYGGSGRYQHIPACEISPDITIQKSAVYHIKEAGHLKYAIKGILNLHMNSDIDTHLFEPYIYPQDARTSFVDLLKSIS